MSAANQWLRPATPCGLTNFSVAPLGHLTKYPIRQRTLLASLGDKQPRHLEADPHMTGTASAKPQRHFVILLFQRHFSPTSTHTTIYIRATAKRITPRKQCRTANKPATCRSSSRPASRRSRPGARPPRPPSRTPSSRSRSRSC